MATTVFACGCECGVVAATAHLISGTGSPTISTTTVRTGSRSLQINPSAGQEYIDLISRVTAATRIFVIRAYVRFATLPNADIGLVNLDGGTNAVAIYFQNSDDKLYCATYNGTSWTVGASGVTVTTDTWYRLDIKINMSANPWTVDMNVDGTACGQATRAVAAASPTFLRLGASINNSTTEIYFDDFLISQTTGDYPLGAGRVEAVTVTSDGSHNVAGADDFEESGTGTDITNATTTAYALIDNVPLPTSVGTYIRIVAPPASTDYVECNFGTGSESRTPTGVEAIVAHHDVTSTGTNNLRVALRDSNGATQANIMSANATNSTTIPGYNRAHFNVIPGSTAWTLTAYQNLRMRCYSNDAAPDVGYDAILLEVAFVDSGPQTVTPTTLALTLTPYAPTVSTPRLVTPTTLAHTLTSYAPTIYFNMYSTPPTLALTLTPYAPTVTTPRLVTPSTLNLLTTPYAPDISVSLIAIPTTLALALTPNAPTITTPRLVTPSTLALILSTYAPLLALTLTPSTLSLALTTYAPKLHLSITPSTLNLLTSLYAPVVSTPRLVTPTTLSLLTSLYAPTIINPQTLTPTTLALTLTPYAPTALVTLLITVPTLSLLLTSYAPTIQGGIGVTPQTASLILTTYLPTVIATWEYLRKLATYEPMILKEITYNAILTKLRGPSYDPRIVKEITYNLGDHL